MKQLPCSPRLNLPLKAGNGGGCFIANPKNPDAAMSLQKNDTLSNTARSAVELSEARLELAKSLAVNFSRQWIEPICRNLAETLPDTCVREKIGEEQSFCSFSGFQMGESASNFIQLLVEFNSAALTLRAIVCRRSKILFCCQQIYEIAACDHGSDGHCQWNEESAANWVEKMAHDAVIAYLREDESS